MLLPKYAEEEAQPKAAVGVSAECLRGGAGRSLVVADYPRHDAAWIPDLQAIPGILRKNRDKHFGGSPAKVGGSWNHYRGTRPLRRPKVDLLAHSKRNRSCTGPYGNGPVGGRARRYRESRPCQANAKGQGEISGCDPAALGRQDGPFRG